MDDLEFKQAVGGLIDQIEMGNYKSHDWPLKDNFSYRYVKRLADALGVTAAGQKRLDDLFKGGVNESNH